MRTSRMVKVFSTIVFLFLLTVPNAQAQGYFEFGVHYSQWSLGPFSPIVKNAIDDALNTDLKDVILEDIKELHPYLQDIRYSQDVEFESSGNNYGFELRWYPGGYYGSFSIGLAVEKTSMNVTLPNVSADLELIDEARFQGNATGSVKINPVSFHLSVRWDIVPLSPINPFITLSFGYARYATIENDEIEYNYSGTLSIPGIGSETLYGGERKTIGELRDELEEDDEEFLPFGFLPFFQLGIGLKGKLTKNLHFLVSMGFWNGFIIRGGVAFRL